MILGDLLPDLSIFRVARGCGRAECDMGSMAQRAIRLFFHLHTVICPNCSVFIEYNTLTELMPDSEKSAPKCTKAFLVVSGVGKPLKKRPARIEGVKCAAVEATRAS